MKKVLEKFNINGNTESVSIPLAPHFKLKTAMSPTTIEKREYMSHVPYASIVGNLMYAIVCTRLICHKLSQWLAETCTISVGVIGR